MLTVSCRDVGKDCDYICKGETEEEAMKNAEQHAVQEGTTHITSTIGSSSLAIPSCAIHKATISISGLVTSDVCV